MDITKKILILGKNESVGVKINDSGVSFNTKDFHPKGEVQRFFDSKSPLFSYEDSFLEEIVETPVCHFDYPVVINKGSNLGKTKGLQYDQSTGDLFVLKTEKNDLNWLYKDLRNGTAEIIGYDGRLPEKILLPNHINGLRVVRVIGESLPESRELENVKSIIIGKSVIEIGDKVFEECYSLEKLIIGENVTSIGMNAFSCCENLKELKIPDKVEIIKEKAFSRCYVLNFLDIGKSVEKIKEKAFEGCRSLQNIICRPITAPQIHWSSFLEIGSEVLYSFKCCPDASGYEDPPWDELFVVKDKSVCKK